MRNILPYIVLSNTIDVSGLMEHAFYHFSQRSVPFQHILSFELNCFIFRNLMTMMMLMMMRLKKLKCEDSNRLHSYQTMHCEMTK